MDFKTIKGKNYYIYDSEQEFRLKYANYGKIKPWRDGEQGDWVFTDDKCVVQVLKKAQLKSHANRKEYYILTRRHFLQITMSMQKLNQENL
jgi:hypothetical protein